MADEVGQSDTKRTNKIGTSCSALRLRHVPFSASLFSVFFFPFFFSQRLSVVRHLREEARNPAYKHARMRAHPVDAVEWAPFYLASARRVDVRAKAFIRPAYTNANTNRTLTTQPRSEAATLPSLMQAWRVFTPKHAERAYPRRV